MNIGKRCPLLRKSLLGALFVSMAVTAVLPPNVRGMRLPVQAPNETAASDGGREADIKTVQSALDSEVVRKRLAKLKLTPEEIEARLGRLSDEQLRQMAKRVHTVNPGGDAGGALVFVLVVGILVGLFLYVFRRI